jgi:phage-related protein
LKYTLPNKNTGYAPEVFALLNALPDEKLFYEEHDLMHPFDVFSSVFEEVIDSGVRLTHDVLEAQRLSEIGEDIKHLDSQIRNGIFNFLFSSCNFLDGCQSIIKSLSSDSKKTSKANREFIKNIKSYNDYLRKLVNFIKHRHRVIRTVYGKWDTNIIVGYFVEGVVKKGSIGPDPEIHKNSNCAISLNRDIPYHLINLYSVSASLKVVIENVCGMTKQKYDIYDTKEEKLSDYINLVSTIPRKFFPDEMKMDWPEIKRKNGEGSVFELAIPSKRKPDNIKPHIINISLTSKVRSRSKSLVLPYFRPE